MVAGVTPGKGGQTFDQVFLYLMQWMRRLLKPEQRFQPFCSPPFAGDAIMEAVDAGIELIVAITEEFQ